MNIFSRNTTEKPAASKLLEIGSEFDYAEGQAISCPRCGAKMSIIGAGDSYAEESWQCGECATVATIEVLYEERVIPGIGHKHIPVRCRLLKIW